MKTKSEKVLPKTSDEIRNGGVYSQRVKCGKKNCRCARGDAHTAYYFFTRIGGKLKKFYVRKSEIKRFVEIAREASDERKRIRQINKSNMNLLKRLHRDLREKQSVIKLHKENYD